MNKNWLNNVMENEVSNNLLPISCETRETSEAIHSGFSN